MREKQENKNKNPLQLGEQFEFGNFRNNYITFQNNYVSKMDLTKPKFHLVEKDTFVVVHQGL
jgi:hypothetical protein